MDIALVDLGLLVALVGLLSVIRPLRMFRIASRHAGAAVLLAGVGVAAIGFAWPVFLTRSTGSLRLDELMPAYHFHEVHSVRVHAPVDRVFRAVRDVTPREILLFHTLMEVRALPERLLRLDRPRPMVRGYAATSFERSPWGTEGRRTVIRYEVKQGARPVTGEGIVRTHESEISKRGGAVFSRQGCCRAEFTLGRESSEIWIELAADRDGHGYRLIIVEPPRPSESMPILDLLRKSGFRLLAEEPDIEIVIGAIDPVGSDAGGSAPRSVTPGEFLVFNHPGFAKLACGFSVRDEGSGWCRVTTETRILGTDPSAARKFALYWRVIAPGSAILRMTWLEAIKRRAVGGPRGGGTAATRPSAGGEPGG